MHFFVGNTSFPNIPPINQYVTDFPITMHGTFTTDYYENGEPMFSHWILQYQCRDLTLSRLPGCFFHNNSLYLGVIIIVLLHVLTRFSILSKIICKKNPQNKCMYRPLVIDYLQNSPFANVLIILLSNFTCSSSTSPNMSCIIL